jgi:hypothetical protein
MKRARACLFGAGLAMSFASGCEKDITEVLVIVDSDLRPFLDVDGVAFIVAEQPFQQCTFPLSFSNFPVSMGFVSGGGTAAFSVTIQLTKNSNIQPQPVVSRTVNGVRFVSEQLRMLSVSLNSACACEGTSCPNPGTNPNCDPIENPATVPFDPAIAPTPAPYGYPCQLSTGGFAGGGPVRAVDTPASVPDAPAVK